MPKVSILMPVKDAGSFLEQTLKSILDQDFQDWELIAIDDHSTDRSGLILDSYSHSDSRIRVFENIGQGIIPALRLALTKSNAELITRMDADDTMPPCKLSLMMHAAEKGNVITGKLNYFREDQPLGDGYSRYADWLNELVDKGDHWNQIYKECVIASPCWMMFREDLVRIGAFDSDVYPEDYDLVFRMYKGRLTVKCIPEILHLWRDHPDRSSRNDPHYSDNRFLDLKLRYYLGLELKKEKELILWGAGKKGKYIAKALNSEGIPFQWTTDNTKKWGHEIHGTLVEQPLELNDSHQVVIAVASEEDQAEIMQILENQAPHSYHFFC